MKDIEYILDFAVNLGAGMLISGAPLERADDTMKRVCISYGLTDISLFSLSSIIQLAARTPDGDYAMRQTAVAGSDLNMTKLAGYNSLSRQVCAEKPEPLTLMHKLKKADEEGEYSLGVRLLGRMIAMTCLGAMFGGSIGDIIAGDLICFVLFWMLIAMSKVYVNQIIVNLLSMFFAGTAGALLVRAGLGQNFYIIIITCSMMKIPGIPLVNAARNLLCGNEMNGILEMIKALLEAFAIVLGFVVSIFLFARGVA